MKISKQEDIKDCGIEIIKSIHYHFFHNILDSNEIKSKVLYGKYGINIKNLIELGSIFGILMEAYEVSFEIIQKNYKNKYFIAIVENQGMNHYIIFKIKNKKVII
jgi:putative ABC transport system ATP-binding protein